MAQDTSQPQFIASVAALDPGSETAGVELSPEPTSCEPSRPVAVAVAQVWQHGGHIPQLDGVRGLAIALVTLYRFAKEFPTDSTIGWLLAQSFRLGDRGVDLFFVLSGFLITGILVDSRRRRDRHYFRSFFARRSLRIFPLYYLAIALSLTAGYWLQPSAFAEARQNHLYLWTYGTNIKMSLEGSWCFGSLDHFWSLAVEEHFYLVWPFVIWFCKPATARWLTIALAVWCGLSRMIFAAISDNGVAPDVATIFRCDALLMGAFLAFQVRTPAGLESLRRIAPGIMAAALLIGLGAAVADKRLLTINHTLWPLIWSAMLTLVLTSSPASLLGRFFALGPLRSLGKYSYAMYVFQNPLIPLTTGLVSGGLLVGVIGVGWLGHLLYVVMMFAITYVMAILSWYAFESHFLRLKRWV